MADYVPPLRDIRFVMEQLADLGCLSKLEAYHHADPETVFGLIEESGRFMAEVIGPLNRTGDCAGSTLHADGRVTTPPGFVEAYQQYVAAGWETVPFPREFGGGGFPWLVTVVMQEMMTSACMAFSTCPLLTQGAIEMLAQHGAREQQATFLEKMVTGEWTGTMNLTEPQAGSDLGAVRAKAVPANDGTWRITGQKIFITYGEHDLADNMGRARLLLPAMRPAVRVRDPTGVPLSCLIVDDNASFLDAAASLLEREGVTIAGVAFAAAEALRKTRELHPDIVLVDIMLGRESGIDLAHRLAEANPDGPAIILISTHAEADFADLIGEAPVAGFVSKLDLSASAIRRLTGTDHL